MSLNAPTPDFYAKLLQAIFTARDAIKKNPTANRAITASLRTTVSSLLINVKPLPTPGSNIIADKENKG